jgi:hypothetical protein
MNPVDVESRYIETWLASINANETSSYIVDSILYSI